MGGVYLAGEEAAVPGNHKHGEGGVFWHGGFQDLEFWFGFDIGGGFLGWRHFGLTGSFFGYCDRIIALRQISGQLYASEEV